MTETEFDCGCLATANDAGVIQYATLCESHFEDYRAGGDPKAQLKYVGGFTEPEPAPITAEEAEEEA